MFLKSIELFGFKSFADRSHIEFTEGISALLGPNGCGKSNVVDAIKWVLGEQATKSLRADRMEDVIFNGTENRKALNVAEVTLTLSNDANLLAVDMPEISLKRRLYRSGESEYFINNTPVKLRELRELFFDTGIGKSAYSIMEQGKIDQILSNKPEERRYLFEEAAGITKYKMRGQEAERKLARTEENMRQVEGILNEVRRSYNTLQGQAEKTIQYRKHRDSIFDLEIDIQLLRLKSFMEGQHQQEERLKERETERAALKQEIDTINESVEENLDQVNTMEAKLIDIQKKLYGIGIERGNRESQVRILTERNGEIEGQIATEQNREQAVSGKIASLETELKERRTGLGELQTRLAEVDENIQGFENAVQTAGGRITQNEKLVAQAEKEIQDLEQAREELQDELRTITDDIVTQLDERLKETGYSARQRAALEEKIHEATGGLSIHIAGRAQLVQDALEFQTQPEEVARAARIALDTLGESQTALDRVQELFAEYRKSTPAFLDEFLAPEGIITQKRTIDANLESNRQGVLDRRRQSEAWRTENRELSQKIDEYRKTLEDLRLSKMRMRTQVSNVEDQITRLTGEIQEQHRQRAEYARRVEENKARLLDIQKQIERLEQDKRNLEKQEKDLQAGLGDLEKSISKRNEELVAKEQRLKTRMDQLGKLQSHVEKAQIELTQYTTEIRNLYDNFRDRYSRELSEFEDRVYEIRTPTSELRSRLAQAREQQKALGQVNLMAPEEFAEVKERFDFLGGQLEDLSKAREDLDKVTREIRTESAELFLSTYEKIKKNFHIMFRRLFGGGRAELRLNDQESVLESGVEILAQPPGKKLENIALLSGGERSLTAVALLFATYMVRPSPFCILDEIDAALDEQNVGRFVAMLQEFSTKSQFIIITHNKKTVAGSQTLLGVTMEESGISKVISIRLDNKREEVHA